MRSQSKYIQAAHRDASVATLNLCLGDHGFEGGELSFWGDGQPGGGIPKYSEDEKLSRHTLRFNTGDVVLHKGQHKHEALPLKSGERVNLIIWMFGEYGQVRVAPYKESDQMSAKERWLKMRGKCSDSTGTCSGVLG